MKKILVLFNLLFLIAIMSHCKVSEIQSGWTNEDCLLDNNFVDISDVSPHNLEEINAAVVLRNNAEYLYLILSSSDVSIKRRAKALGLTVWINDSNKKQKTYGVQHGGESISERNFQIRDSFWSSLTSEQKTKFEQIHKEMQNMITVINKGNERQIPPENPEGPAVVEAYEEEKYYLVFRIPFQKSLANSNSSQRKTAMIGLELGTADRNKTGGMDRMMGDLPDGEFMRGGGRRGGNMRISAGGGQRSTHQEIWRKVVLGKQS